MRQAAKDLEEADMRVYTRMIAIVKRLSERRGLSALALPFSLVKQLQSEEKRYGVRRSR